MKREITFGFQYAFSDLLFYFYRYFSQLKHYKLSAPMPTPSLAQPKSFTISSSVETTGSGSTPTRGSNFLYDIDGKFPYTVYGAPSTGVEAKQN